MEYDEKYLGVKKIVVIEEIAKMISDNKYCWDADLRGFVNNQEVIDKIGTMLAGEKADEQIVKEIRSLFDKYEIVY